jgi:hypothetical protein
VIKAASRDCQQSTLHGGHTQLPWQSLSENLHADCPTHVVLFWQVPFHQFLQLGCSTWGHVAAMLTSMWMP